MCGKTKIKNVLIQGNFADNYNKTRTFFVLYLSMLKNSWALAIQLFI